MKLIHLESISSLADSHGNCYHAMRVTNKLTGAVLEFTISGDNSGGVGYELFHGWANATEFAETSTTQLKSRQFDKEVKGWAHGGCVSKDIAAYIVANGGLPTFWEAISKLSQDTGIELNNHESDLYVPISPAVTRLCDAYGKTGVMRSTFRDNISGKLSYDIPFAYQPYWEAVAAKSAKMAKV